MIWLLNDLSPILLENLVPRDITGLAPQYMSLATSVLKGSPAAAAAFKRSVPQQALASMIQALVPESKTLSETVNSE